MRLHIVYRSTGGENDHPRPAYYSKMLALASCLRARERCGSDGGDVVFVNDGAIPSDRLELMSDMGRVVGVGHPGIVGSYLTALGLACRQPWAGGDAVYLVEDDYLWDPDAFVRLLDAVRAAPPDAYLSCYGNVHRHLRPLVTLPAGGGTWRSAESFTSTFATRMETLRSDAWLHRTGARCAGGDWDWAICLSYQGLPPYSGHELADAALGRVPGSPSWPTRVNQTVWRLALDAASLSFRRRWRVTLTAVPALATHLELPPFLAPYVDWEAIALDTVSWARARGITVPGDWIRS